MMFCASKTPALRNRTATVTSKSDPLALVVWATTVASARLLEPVAGTLKIKQTR